MEIKDPHELYDLVEAVHHNAGYKASELSRTNKEKFTSAETKDEFGFESFKRGTKVFVYPRRGKFFCRRGGYCPLTPVSTVQTGSWLW